MSKTKVLFVCMGNICRSPTAQGVFERLVEEAGLAAHVDIDSAGTHAYHVGEPPDRRATQAAAGRGIDLTSQRARRVREHDFESFDYVLAMDHDNLDELRAICPAHYQERVRLLLEFAETSQHGDVPDPYYGGAQGFERVLDMVEDGAQGLLEEIRQRIEVS
ncbi:protein tyrosine phosphatase [Thiogranum longum]|uniref:protein-tyrosine-phosphatase n=1 Tax=Thiogranum longum TaxID=1537524 RepID=A0A4R1HM98_9GAMM|nr:low molecular weight protein-tyrosine-phosphatase [Thiogranum longum]TCK18362.1 protein tyrosine phosphatase [Thiogranum longum]